MPRKKNETINFETSLKELNDIVEKMEEGGLTLEDSLKQFEHGIKLTRQCQAALKEAEQKVKILIEQNSVEELKNFHEDEEDA